MAETAVYRLPIFSAYYVKHCTCNCIFHHSGKFTYHFCRYKPLLSLSSSLSSGPDLDDRGAGAGAGDGDDRGGGDGGGRGGGGGGRGGPPGDSSRMKKSAQQVAGERVLSRAVQEVEGVSFSFR